MITLPRYRCHKEVSALKIASIDRCELPNTGARLEFTEPEYEPIDVSGKWIEKHDPKVGGYYVRYDDDYSSFSPAEPFESGYTRL